jgi:hypothetical protein
MCWKDAGAFGKSAGEEVSGGRLREKRCSENVPDEASDRL